MAGTAPRYKLVDITDEPRLSAHVVIAHGLELSTVVVPVSYYDEDQQLCVDDLTIRTILGCRYGADENAVIAMPLERVFYKGHEALWERLQEWVLAEWKARNSEAAPPTRRLISQWEGQPTCQVIADYDETVCPLTDNLFDSRYFDGGLLVSLPRWEPEAAQLTATGTALVTPGGPDGTWDHAARAMQSVTIPLLVRWDATRYTDDATISTSAFCPLGITGFAEGLSKLVFRAEMGHRIHTRNRPPRLQPTP